MSVNPSITSEVIVRLMRPNRWRELGLTRQEALDLVKAYAQELAKLPGNQTDTVLQYIDNAVLQPLEPPEPLVSQRGAAGSPAAQEAGGVSAHGPPGFGSGARADVSGRDGAEEPATLKALAPRARAAATAVAQKAQGTAISKTLLNPQSSIRSSRTLTIWREPTTSSSSGSAR
jgi:hypothetical protein